MELHLRRTIDIDMLEAFIDRHQDIRQLSLAAMASLRPLGSSQGPVLDLLRKILAFVLSPERVQMVMEHAEKHAKGHERSFLH